jgi:hypothetical protein
LIVEPQAAPTEPKKPEVLVETIDEADDEANDATTSVEPNQETVAPLRVIAAMPTTNLPDTNGNDH